MSSMLGEVAPPGRGVAVDREPQPQCANTTLLAASNGPNGVAAPMTIADAAAGIAVPVQGCRR
ncbi:hypothetical protein MHOL44478_18670 [Mycobacterium holsaticum DSM 44478]|nr:hypothetical protein [Mycolicibacterium holsaticum DSM 44478 = JCM 12374]